jgi:hypothetical protein
MNDSFLKIKVGCLLIVLIFILNCDGSIQEAQNLQTVKPSQVLKLHSGKEIKVNRNGKMDFPYGQSSVYVLEYETEIGTKDIETLHKEVDEILETIEVEVEKSQLKEAVIRAANYQGDGVLRCKGFGFGYSKQDNGKWDIKEDAGDCRVSEMYHEKVP